METEKEKLSRFNKNLLWYFIAYSLVCVGATYQWPIAFLVGSFLLAFGKCCEIKESEEK